MIQQIKDGRMKTASVYITAVLLGLPQFAFSDTWTLENSKSTYEVFDASGKPQGYLHYEFENRNGNGIDSIIVKENLDGSKSRSVRRVSVQDYILAHEQAVRDKDNCTSPETF